MVIVVFAHIQGIYGTRLAWAAGIEGGLPGRASAMYIDSHLMF